MSSEDTNQTAFPGTMRSSASVSETMSALMDRFSTEPTRVSNTPRHAHFVQKRIFDIGSIAKLEFPERDVLLYAEQQDELYETSVRDVLSYLLNRQPWEQYDLYVLSSTVSWCVVVTHDDELIVVDPDNELGSLGD